MVSNSWMDTKFRNAGFQIYHLHEYTGAQNTKPTTLPKPFGLDIVFVLFQILQLIDFVTVDNKDFLFYSSLELNTSFYKFFYPIHTNTNPLWQIKPTTII